MAINQVQPLSASEVAQAYSVPLEDTINNMQQQQQLALQQQRYNQQMAMQQEQMNYNRLNDINDVYSKFTNTGTPYDEKLLEDQRRMIAEGADYLKKNPKDFVGARFLASKNVNEYLNKAAQAKSINDQIDRQLTDLDKDNPYYNINQMKSDLINQAYKDADGKWLNAPNQNAVYGMQNMQNDPRYLDPNRFESVARKHFADTYKPDESVVDVQLKGRIPYSQQISNPFFSQFSPETGSFSTKSQPITIGEKTFNTLPPNVSSQFNQDPYVQKGLPLFRQQLLASNPELANATPQQIDEIAKYAFVDRMGNAVKSSVDKPNYDQYKIREQARQDAIDNRMAQERLNIAQQTLELRKQGKQKTANLLADANVMKDAFTGTNRNGTTREQQQAVFSKYAAPIPPNEAINAFLSKYSKGPQLAEAFKIPVGENGRRIFNEQDLGKYLTPVNISGAYTNGKLVNPFNGQKGTAQMWVDPVHNYKKSLVFISSKTKKDSETGFVVTVPDYENMKVYEGEEGARFIDQLKDSEAEKGLNATNLTDEEE